MRNAKLKYSASKKHSLLFILFFLLSFLLSGCSSTASLRVSPFYYFDYNGESYRIRSISSSDITQSRNELLGKNFLAADSDQDGTIDQIVLGEISLFEIQKIYNYGLALLEKEHKLREITPDKNRFQYVNTEYTYEIRTFHTTNGQVYNQLKIISNSQLMSKKPIVIIDKNANGKLDAVLKGDVSADKFQKKYDELLQDGLQKKDFIMVDNRILLNEKQDK